MANYVATSRAAKAGLVLLFLGASACAQSPTSNPGTVNRLLQTPPPASGRTFRPLTPQEMGSVSIPEPTPYRLGIGDAVNVKVVSASPIAGFGGGGYRARVKDNGTIRLPLIGPLEVQNLSAVELEELLNSEEGEIKKFDGKAMVDVEIVSYAAQKFYVVGEVGQPSTLPVTGKTTLLETLIEVGGTNEETADLDEAYIIRNMMPMPFSVADVVQRGHPAGRIIMMPNDIVYIPHVRERQEFVYVFGEVNSPSRIPMDRTYREKNGHLTLAAAIADAGGLNPRANINKIMIFRGGWRNASGYCLSVCDVNRFGHDIYLRAGDRISVGTSDAAKFTDAIGPTLQIIGASTSALSLGFSAQALTK